jgi:outer membrane receptor for ferrienterochelin and colicin
VRDISEVTTLLAGWTQISRRTDTAGFTAGLRIASRTLATGSGVSPWLLGERTFGHTTIRGGLGSSVQFYDPTLVLAGTEPIRPERAFAADLGIVHQLGQTTSVRVTGFARNESDVVRRIGEDRVDPVRNVRIPATTFPVYRGSIDGTSRGVDVTLMRRATSGLTGWVGYTYSHTKHHDTVSDERFDADQDQRHTLNVFALQRLSYRMTVGAKLRIGSNFPLVGYFEQQDDLLFLSSERNRVRLPLYSRLDVRVNRTFTFSRSRTSASPTDRSARIAKW